MQSAGHKVVVKLFNFLNEDCPGVIAPIIFLTKMTRWHVNFSQNTLPNIKVCSARAFQHWFIVEPSLKLGKINVKQFRNIVKQSVKCLSTGVDTNGCNLALMSLSVLGDRDEAWLHLAKIANRHVASNITFIKTVSIVEHYCLRPHWLILYFAEKLPLLNLSYQSFEVLGFRENSSTTIKTYTDDRNFTWNTERKLL